MKTCASKMCSLQGKPQPESSFHWSVKGERRKTRCKTCANSKERKRIKVKYENERAIEQAGISKEGLLFNQLITIKW